MDPSPQQRRRNARSASGDERPQRTKLRLAAALTDVLNAGTEASVASVSAAAGVGRSTFYTHFTSLDELIDFAIVALFADLAPLDHERRSSRALGRLEITQIGLSELLDGLLGNQALLALAAASPASERLRTHLIATMASSLRNTILAERPLASDAFVEITSQYIASGVIAVTLDAIERPDRFDRAELTATLVEALPAWLTGGDTAPVID